jgi:hypothetical protein
MNFLDRFSRHSNNKFHENSSSEGRVIYSMQTDGQTDMMKLIVTFRNSANTPTNLFSSYMASFIYNLIKVLHVLYSHSSKLDNMAVPHPSYNELTYCSLWPNSSTHHTTPTQPSFNKFHSTCSRFL